MPRVRKSVPSYQLSHVNAFSATNGDRLNFSDHIKRRHGSNLEAAAGSAFRLPVTGEMVVDEGSAKRSHSIPVISMNDLNDSFWKESPRNSNDDGADDSSQSLWHG